MMPDLHYTGVSCRFGGRRRGTVAALEGLTLRCAAATPTCLIGPNGAGKSTALALAAGLLPATAGQITFGNRLVGPQAPPYRLAYLPQVSSFPARLTAGEVLELSAAARGSASDALQEALSGGGFEPLHDQPIGTLSSGWLRRLGLAVALLPPADLLLLDEPFVGLDLETLDRVVDVLIRRAEQGATVVLCSHDFEVVDRLRARLVVLHEGRLLGVAEAGETGSRAFYRRTLSQTSAPDDVAGGRSLPPAGGGREAGIRKGSGLRVVGGAADE